MKKFKRFFNGRLFYSLAVGILAVGIAATGAMLLGDNGTAEEDQYLALEEPSEEAVSAPVFSEESTLSWPIHGSILREYSMDTTVFYPTLESYKVSPGILIQGEPDMEVSAAAAGVVKTISNNEEIGNYVVEGCNLYFEVTKDGSPVDPLNYMYE